MSSNDHRTVATKTANQDSELGIARVSQIKDKDLVKKRRDQILDAALDLFSEKGFKSTTIRQICEKSGVNQGSLYDYVKNKDDIMERLMQRMYWRGLNEEGRDLLRARHFDTLEDYVRDNLEYSWSQNSKATLLTFRVFKELSKEQAKSILGRDSRLVGRIKKVIVELKDVDEDDPRVDVLANFIVYTYTFVPMREWNMKEMSREFLVTTMTDMIVAMADSLIPDHHQK
ncbi:MAG: TetR/AcrR family transcriptional regulator [Sneathiella sp.]|nr:TetR/AcrR family transcriptional regulator [Sneathiella sp.]